MRTAKTRPSRRGALAAGAASIALLAAGAAQALPTGPGNPIVAGGAVPTISGTGGALTVDLNAPRTIIAWRNGVYIASRMDRTIPPTASPTIFTSSSENAH